MMKNLVLLSIIVMVGLSTVGCCFEDDPSNNTPSKNTPDHSSTSSVETERVSPTVTPGVNMNYQKPFSMPPSRFRTSSPSIRIGGRR